MVSDRDNLENQENPERAEQRQTRNLVWKFSTIAFGLPLAGLLGLYLFSVVTDYPLEPKHWKRAVFFTWGATMLILARLGFVEATRNRKTRLAARSNLGNKAYQVTTSRTSQVGKWESKNTRRMLIDFAAAFLLIPAMSLAIVIVTCATFGWSLSGDHWVQVIGCVWLGALLCGIYYARKAFRKRIG